MNTPVRLPRNEATSIPASSKTSHEVSRTSRCCGSMASASRGEIPKKSASKSARPSMKPPSRTYEVSAESGSSSKRRSRSQPRSFGNGVMPSPPATSRSHSSLGVVTPPGKRQAIPMIAIGSSPMAVVGATVWSAGASSNSSSRRKAARASGVAWSKIRVAGSRSPVAVSSWLRNSTAVSEVNPRSVNARAGATAEEYSSTAAIWPQTRSSSARSRSGSVSPVSRSRNARAVGVSAAAGPRFTWAPGSSSNTGIVRPAANAGANRDQSASTIATAVSRASKAASSSATARAGDSGVRPRLSMVALTVVSSAMPSAQGPHAIAVAARPSARRCRARRSRAALAAA
nr:hypothetical protein [Actinosynnema sp. ALI-1.44]